MKGECNATVSYKGENQTLPLIVVEKAGTSIFALNWTKSLMGRGGRVGKSAGL